ncbi:MAG: hypothetical protein ACOCRX_12035 [Candidatus Woesearchaeota archaeon]
MSNKVCKNKLVEDLLEVLKSNNIHKRMKKNNANYAIYNWTEYNGKYEGVPFWSLKALEYYNKTKNGRLVHEHIIPRNIVISELIRLESINKDNILDILKKSCIAAVITKEEDKYINEVRSNNKSLRSIMPIEYHKEIKGKEKYYKEPWARYLKSNEYHGNRNDLNKIITILNIEKEQVEVKLSSEKLNKVKLYEDIKSIKKNNNLRFDIGIKTLISLNMDERFKN